MIIKGKTSPPAVCLKLQEARDSIKLTQAQMAARLGLSRETYAKYEIRSPLPARLAPKVAEITGINLTSLLTGDDAIPHQPPVRGRPPGHTKQTGIPEIDVRAGAGGGGEAMVEYRPDGNGGLMAGDHVRAEWGIPPEFVRTVLGVTPKHARIIEISGDSMEPTLSTGDRVMVNVADRAPSPPGIFALWDGFGVVAKRVEHIPNSDPPRLKIKSDNGRYDIYERTADEVQIIGRIVWAARRV